MRIASLVRMNKVAFELQWDCAENCENVGFTRAASTKAL